MWDEWSGLKMTKGLGVWSTLAMEEGTFWYVGEVGGIGKEDYKDLTIGWINGNSKLF